MKKVIKLTESELNKIIKKVMSEQEGQVMNTGPSPEQMLGTEDGETDAEPHAQEGPDFEQFLNCAKDLLAQDVTIGDLVDKIVFFISSSPLIDRLFLKSRHCSSSRVKQT